MIVTTITARTTTGTQAYIIGGQPVALLLWSACRSADGVGDGYRWIQGMTDGTTQVCRSVGMQDSAASPTGNQLDAPGYLYRRGALVAGGSGTIEQEATLVSFNSTGFTLNWSVANGEATKINVLAFTDDEFTAANLVTVFCDDNPEIISGIGFAASLVITLGGTTTDLTPYSAGPFCAMPGFGFSDGVENYCMDAVGRLSGSVTPGNEMRGGGSTTPASTVIRYISSVFEGFIAVGEAIGNIVPDGFDASKGGFGATSLYHYFLALETPLEVAIGHVDQVASGSVDLDLAFDPVGLILFASGAPMAAGGTSEGGYAMGAWTVDGTTRHAAALANRTGGVTHTATAQGTGALKFYSPASTGSASTLVLGLSVVDDGHALQFDTSDAGGRAVAYIAIGSPGETEVNRCEGGTVPQVPDPPDGYSPEGLGPHTDRFFIETDLTTAGMQRWALQDPMRDAPDLESHPGHKPGRILQCGSIIRRSTDRLGAWNAATARWSADDHDRAIRGSMASEPWFNREFRPYLCDRADVENARCLGRFIIQDHPPSAELIAEIEGLDIIGTEFSPFALDRDILSSVVFSRVQFPLLPATLADLHPPQPVPVYGGRWSDQGSADGVLAWRAFPTRGGITFGGGQFHTGYGDMVSDATPPTTVTATALAGGTLSADVANSEYGFLVTAIDASGHESDPYPFHVHKDSGGGRGSWPATVPTIYGTQTCPSATVDGTQKIRVEWSGATGAVAYRCYIGTWYYNARFSHYIQTTNEFCEFDDLATATRNRTIEITYYTAIARTEDGLTGPILPEIQTVETGPRRVVRMWITPLDGALEYFFFRRGVIGGWTRQWSVATDQLEGGYIYFDDDYLDTDVTAITELPSPHGMLPVWDVGDELLSDGEIWGALVLCRWPVAEIEGVLQNGQLITDSPDLLHPDHDNWADYFPTRYVTKGGVDYTILYARGALLAAHRAAAGTALADDEGGVITPADSDIEPGLIQVNACTTEDIGDGLGNVITIGPRLAQHMLAELVRNDHMTGTWTGIPAFPDGVYEIKTSSYLRAENAEIARIGEGYPSRMAFTHATTVRQFFEMCCQGLGLHHAIDHHGRVMCGHYDDALDFDATYRTFADVREITGNIVTIPMTSEMENRIPYQADFRPVDDAYAMREVYVEDADAITANRGRVKAGPERQTQFAATARTWDDVLYRALLLGRYVRTWVEVPVGIVGLNVDIFDIFRVTDEAGIGASGWDGEYVLCLEHEIIPPNPQNDQPTLVVLKGLDITGIVAAAGGFAPDDGPDTWEDATPEEQAELIAWASDDGKIPPDGDPGKEWR